MQIAKIEYEDINSYTLEFSRMRVQIRIQPTNEYISREMTQEEYAHWVASIFGDDRAKVLDAMGYSEDK